MNGDARGKRYHGVLKVGVVVALVLLAIIGFMYWPFAYSQAMSNVLPQYDAQNQAIVEALPSPPMGAVIVREFHEGIQPHPNEFGRLFTIQYETEQAFDAVTGYYEPVLVSNGWRRLGRTGLLSSYLATFYRDTSCIEFFDTTYGYEVRVWHDFEKQSFSPWTPPRWLLTLYSGGKAVFVECRY